MILMETARKIRMKHRQGESIRKISETFQVSRNTVRRFLRMEEIEEPKYERKDPHYPQLGSFVEKLNQLIEADEKSPTKLKRTMQSMYEELRMGGYQGSYSPVCRYIRGIQKASEKLTLSKVYIPLSFEPGEAYQFDWSEDWVEIDSKMVKVKVAHIILCYSRKRFAYAYLNETQEMVFDAHIRAFEFFGGVTHRGIYDNMRTVIKKILAGKGREWSQGFECLCAHYRVEPVACNPRSGWEKGRVERQVSTDRAAFFNPVPKVSSMAELNQILASQVVAYNRSHKHPEYKAYTLEEIFIERERPHLGPLPTRFTGSKHKDVKISSTCLAMYDRNHYSVECQYAGKIAVCKATADTLTFVYHGHEIGRHERRFGRGNTYYNWPHYLPVLLRKPGALRNGAPFKEMGLPDELTLVRNHLDQSSGVGAKDFVKLLAYIPQTSIEAVQSACRQAIEAGTMSVDVIGNILFRTVEEPEKEPPFSVPGHLILTHTPTSDCSRYNQLLTEVRS